MTDCGDGTVCVEIGLAAAIEDDGSWVAVAIDTGVHACEGHSTAFDYLVLFTSEGGAFAKWDGSAYGPLDHHAVSLIRVGGRVAFTLTLSDLGVESFDFWVASGRGGDVDLAPGSGRRSYRPGP
jgi:hypothetical protein